MYQHSSYQCNIYFCHGGLCDDWVCLKPTLKDPGCQPPIANTQNNMTFIEYFENCQIYSKYVKFIQNMIYTTLVIFFFPPWIYVFCSIYKNKDQIRYLIKSKLISWTFLLQNFYDYIMSSCMPRCHVRAHYGKDLECNLRISK